MKKLSLVFVCFCLVTFTHAQTWNLTLNTVAGNPNFGTLNNKPIDFFTNNVKRMTLGTDGNLLINGLAGTGSRFLQVDATGVLTEWTGSVPNYNKILFGDNTWKTFPFNIDGTNITLTASGSKFGIGLSGTPTVELDVNGNGKISGDLNVGGKQQFANNFRLETTGPVGIVPTLVKFTPNSTPGAGPTFPAFVYQPPCNVWYSATAINTPEYSPYVVPWAPPTSNIFYDLIQIYQTNQNKSVLSMGMLNGDGIIAVEPLPTNTVPPKLKINPGCSNDVYICEGGGYTKIFNNAGVGGTLRVGPGNYFSPGSQFDMYLASATTKAITIIDPALTSANKNIFEMSKTGQAILGINVQAIAGSMLSIGQPVKTVPGISLMDNSVTPNLPIFNVYGNGLTEITSSTTKALSIKNALNNNYETFSVNRDGYTEIKVYAPTGMPAPYSAGHRAFTIRDMSGTMQDIFVVNSNGKVYAREVEISIVPNFPDYVFNLGYELKPIAQVEDYISENKHLPGFEKGEYYEKNGINVNDMFVKQQEKIEELMLYIIQLEKRMQEIEKHK